MATFPAIATMKSIAAFQDRLGALGIEVPIADPMPAPAELALARPWSSGRVKIGNRWCIHPMEGWDALPDGRPSELTIRRWQRFGESGAKLIWGGEAAAVRSDGRANPNQLRVGADTMAELAALRAALVKRHVEVCGNANGLLVGLQLTHSGRYSRPNRKERLESRIAYHHPVLDKRCGIASDDAKAVLSDGEVEQLVADFITAAALAAEAGFDFVDVKHCHGYLLHEFLSARHRAGRYGGDFTGRTRLATEIINGIKRECPQLLIGVRLSAFDITPFRPDPAAAEPGRLGVGIAETAGADADTYAFGMKSGAPEEMDLTEPIQFIKLLHSLGVFMVNASAGSPYYNPHVQRPALFPPSDGYQPPEDPLVGVARQMVAVRELKRAVPEMPLVGSGYSYLQEFLPQVAEGAVAAGWTDFVGLGRMVLPYPELPMHVLAGRPLERRQICRTFSDCTSAPRQGMVSGCFPLDPFYKARPEAAQVRELKQR